MNSVEEEQPKLRIWPSKYGLPSFDAAGIVTMTYAKINGISLNVQVGSIPQWTPIPSLDDGKTVVTTTPEILDVLKSQVSTYTSDLTNVSVTITQIFVCVLFNCIVTFLWYLSRPSM